MTDTFNLQDTLEKYITKPSESTTPRLSLIYSPPGQGKTFFGATASRIPGVRKMLILDTEGSTTGTLGSFDDDVIDIISVEKEDEVESFQFLNAILEKLFDKDTVHEYDVVMIDTFDVAQGWAHKYFDANAPTGRSGEKDGFAVWGNVKDWSISVARNMKRIDAFGVLVVHDTEEKNKDGALVTRLNLLGKAKDVLPGIPDVVVYLNRVLEGEEEITFGYFATQDGKVTKNRFQFPPVVKNPSFDGLFKYIEDRKAEKDNE